MHVIPSPQRHDRYDDGDAFGHHAFLVSREDVTPFAILPGASHSGRLVTLDPRDIGRDASRELCSSNAAMRCVPGRQAVCARTGSFASLAAMVSGSPSPSHRGVIRGVYVCTTKLPRLLDTTGAGDFFHPQGLRMPFATMRDCTRGLTKTNIKIRAARCVGDDGNTK